MDQASTWVRGKTAATTATDNSFSHGRWLLVALAAMLATLGALEANYRWGFRAPGNETGIQVAKLERLPVRHYRAVLLSDSMTHNPMRDYRMSDEIVDLTTSNGPTLVGAKFMAQRFFKTGATTDEVVLFLRPEYFNRDLSDVANGLFLRFHEPEELAELSRFGLTDYRRFHVYINTRMKALDVANYFITHARMPKRAFDAEHELETGFISTRTQTLNDDAVGARPENVRFLREFSRLCNDNGARLTIVLEPMLQVDYKRVRGSKLEAAFNQLHEERTIRYVDANVVAPLPDEAFFDGVHPRKNWGKYYLLQIDEHIVKLF